MSSPPDNRPYLRPDCFGLQAFASACACATQPGDIVQIDRLLYSEWALCVDSCGLVAHVASVDACNNDVGSSDVCNNDVGPTSGVVRLLALEDMAQGALVRVNNKSVGAKERGLEPQPLERVLESCCQNVGLEVPFNMLTRNSEHYVTEWKYGTGWSDQAAVTMSVMKTLSSDCNIGHNELVNSLNAVLNSPGSPASRSPPTFPCSPLADGKIH